MDLDELARSWDALGESDPLWAILALPGTRAGRWDIHEFFRTGETEIDEVLGYVEGLGWPLRRGRALDFGCGVGRLAQALCRHFDEVDGVDVAPSMIRAAEKLNHYGECCRYHLNHSDDLALFPDDAFDFVYSTYVLQHIPPLFARRYVEEFVRLLASGGLALFQIPTARRAPAPNDPMPEDAFVGSHELLGDPPGTVPAGEHVFFRVHVTNRSVFTWPTRGHRMVLVGALWRRDGGIFGDQARGSIPADIGLGPGEDVTITLALRAPERPGRYTLELGLLQEHVAWFADRGGPMTRLEVEVVEGAEEDTPGAAPTPDDPADPRMEMYTTPAGEVISWVIQAGGRVVGTTEVVSPGRELFYEQFEGGLFAVTGAS